MALKQDIYRAFEDVLSPENISDDPVILDSYAWRSSPGTGPDLFVPRFEAILLPQSTEEVQALVKLCNRFKIQFKASSTGWSASADPPGPGVVKFDLRRMNRIIEINEKSMYAVVEPYVIHAQLQAELMKRGLQCNVTGAGGNTSALPLAAVENIGHLGESMSYGERNLLAMEWVTPEGEIVKFGTLAHSGEWFCGDGPGPSLRGVIRGNITPLGGLGVYTKAAMKVFHWPGPAVFPVEGISPDYAPPQMPDRFLVRYYSFAVPEERINAIRKINESEIATILMGFTASMVASNMARSNEEELKYLEQLKKSVEGPGFMIVIIGNSDGEFEYKNKVLQKIIEQTGGKSLKLIEDPKVGGALLWRSIRVTASIRETLRATGAFGGVVGGTDVITLQTKFIDGAVNLKMELIKQGLVMDDGAETFFWTFEHGHYAHAELLLRFHVDPTALGATRELMINAYKNTIAKSLSMPHVVFGDHLLAVFNPYTLNFTQWLREFKRSFDPDNISESTHYISGK